MLIHRSALLGAEAAEFTTPEGIGLKIEAGTFAGPVTARIVEETDPQALAPISSKFQRLRAFQVDLGGILPHRPFKLSIPSPSFVTPQNQVYIGLEVSFFGEKKIMVMDTMALKDGRLETNSPPWPECDSGGRYSVLFRDPVFPMGLFFGSLFYQPCQLSTAELCYINGYFINRPNFIIPVGVGEDYTLKIRALDTGQVLYEGRLQGPDSASGVVEFKENITHDVDMPFLLTSTLENTMAFELARLKTQSQGLTVEATDSDGNGLPDQASQVTVTGDTQAADPGGLVRIYNLTAKTNPVEVRADTEGKFTATFTASFKDKIIITLPKGNIPLNQEFTFGFSEPLDEATVSNETVRLLEVRDGSEYSIAGKAKLLESKTEVVFIPDTGLREDTVYTLSLKGLSDPAGNLLPEVKSDFRTKKSSLLGFVEAKTVSDSLLVGHILVVASADEGLKLFDVSDPTNMVPLSTFYVSHARGLSKEDLPTLDLDPQGRIILVGGGSAAGGYIKIVDISDPTDPVQVGTQKITERVGLASSYYDMGLPQPPTTLPEAYPRRVQSLSGYAFVGTVGGGFEIIDEAKIGSMTSDEPGIILAIFQEVLSVFDLAAFQDATAGRTYLVTCVYGIKKGLKLYDVTQPALITEMSEYNMSSTPHKVELALGYPYDADADGTVEEGEKRDLLFASIPGEEKIKVLDITDRTFREVGEVKTPGAPGAMVVDREAGVLYAHAGEHLLLIDIRDIKRWEQPGYLFLDANADGVDDRIMSRVKTRAGLCQALSVDTNLKIAYVGNFDQGVEVVRVDPPRVEIVEDTDENGVYEAVEEVLPYGLEKNAQGNPVASPRNFVYLSAFFPGTKSSTITADLWSVNFEGDLLPDWGKTETRLKAVVLKRQSDDPKSEKFSFFVSDKIQVTVDPESPYAEKKILSGEYLRAVLSPELSDVYSREGVRYVSKEELWQGMDYVKSVRAEWIDSAKPEPAQNASVGRGELGGAVYLHSGEFALSEVDLRIPGRGLDFELRRTYESQSIYSGPFGWNWDHTYNRRLQELPDGSLVYFDGEGRRDVFRAMTNEEGVVLRYEPPGGRFAETYRRLDGSVTMRDEKGVIQVFNGLGRLARIMDRNGNALEFAYDLSGKLSSAMDTMGRLIQFEYYPWVEGDVRSGRLRSVTDFSGRKVEYAYNEAGDLISANFEGRVTHYAYTAGTNLKSGHNLEKVTDPKGQKAIENFYDSSDEVSGQKVGGVSISVNAGLSATTTDGNGHMRSYMHDEKGRPISETEGGYTTSYSYNTDGLITSVNYPMGNTVSYTYDSGNPGRTSQANLLRMTESPGPRGSTEPSRVTSFTYDPSSNEVLSISSPNGLTVEHMLDSQGNIIEAKMNIPGMESGYSYNQYGQLISETDPESGTRTYNYYPEAAPGGTSSTLGGRALDPGTGGYLQQAASPLSFERYEYDGNGNLRAHSNSEGVSRSWSVDKFNLVTSESATGPGSVSPYNFGATYAYDANGNVETKNEAWGGNEAPVSRTTTYIYNTQGSVLSSTETGRGTTAYAYDGNENLTSVTDPEGKSICFTYDARNLVSSFRRGENGPANAFDYDGNKNLHMITDGRGKATTLSYDGYDRLKSVHDALGNETVVSRSQMGNLAEVRNLDSAGKLLKQSVTVNDPLGRIVGRSEKLLDPAGQTVEEIVYQYRYEEGGRVVVVVDPLGRESMVIKNELGNVIKEIDAAGNETEYYYEDGRGNMTRKAEKEKKADGSFETYVTRYEDNSFNKVTKVIDSLNESWVFTYDEMGNLSGSLDPEGNTVSHAYDALGRKIKTERHFTNGTKQVTEFTYDNSNNIRSIKDSNGNVTQYDYDELNRLVKVAYPDTTFIEYSYDGNSNIVVEKQRNGTRVENTYDDINRLVARNIQRAAGVEGTAAETYGYDGASRLVRAADEDSEVEFVHDSLDRLLEEQQNGKAVKYTYDKLGNRTSLQYPNQRIIEREFDLLNRMAKVKQGTEQVADFTFVGRAFRAVSRTYGNGDTVNELYDLGRRLTGREAKNKNAEIISQYVYGYNKVGMKTFEQRGHDAGKGDLFNYDELYRLNQVKMNSPEPQNPSTSQFEKSKTYNFDKVDNILKIIETQNDQTREILTQVNNLNQYTQFDALNLTYDANGNLYQKGAAHYTYDYRNRLVSVEDGANTTSFKYDVLGRRIEKSATGASPVRYYYDGYRVIEERDGSDAVMKQYIHGNGIDELLWMDKFSGSTPSPYYVHTNAIGSATAITDNDGNLIERVSYDDYGKPTFTDYLTDPQNPTSRTFSIIGNDYLFQGREYDPETGLYNYRARYFDPQIARFLQTDLVGYRDSMNLYQALGQSPANYVDPFGEIIYLTGDNPQSDFKWFVAVFKAIGIWKIDGINIEEYLTLKKDNKERNYIDLSVDADVLKKSSRYPEREGKNYPGYVRWLKSRKQLKEKPEFYEKSLEELLAFIILDRERKPIEFRTGSLVNIKGKDKPVNAANFGGGVTAEPFETKSGNIEIVVNPESYSRYTGWQGSLLMSIPLIIVHELGHALGSMWGYTSTEKDKDYGMFWDLSLMLENLYRIKRGEEYIRSTHGFPPPLYIR